MRGCHCLVDARDKPRSASPIGVVLLAELYPQQGFFGANACEERRDNECYDNYAGYRTKGQSSTQHQDNHPAMPGVANETVRAIGDRLMPRLDGHQGAESTDKDENGPDSQRAARNIEKDTEPSNGIAIKKPPPRLSLDRGWQKRSSG